VFGRKLAIDDELYEKLKQCSENAGYSSPQEFALHVLEKESDRILNRGSESAGEVSEEPTEPPAEERGELPVAGPVGGPEEGPVEGSLEEPARESLPEHVEGTGDVG